ncbi:unnamed protein product [Colias eurytheme]|nr:unnamed protein product [Colias eurytheme]
MFILYGRKLGTEARRSLNPGSVVEVESQAAAEQGYQHVSLAPGTIHVGRRPARAPINTAATGGQCPARRATSRTRHAATRAHDRPPQMTEPARTIRDRRTHPILSTLRLAALPIARSHTVTIR